MSHKVECSEFPVFQHMALNSAEFLWNAMAWRNAVFSNSDKGWGKWEISLWGDFFI